MLLPRSPALAGESSGGPSHSLSRHFVTYRSVIHKNRRRRPDRCSKRGSAGISVPRPYGTSKALKIFCKSFRKGCRSSESNAAENTSREKGRACVSKVCVLIERTGRRDGSNLLAWDLLVDLLRWRGGWRKVEFNQQLLIARVAFESHQVRVGEGPEEFCPVVGVIALN
jgi:hypothetical protein